MHTVLQADWPVTMLDLQNTALSRHDVSLLMAHNWPCLSRLNLNSTSLSTNACLKLLTGNWPLLKSRHLGQNQLDASIFKQMVEDSRLLHLTELHLPDTGLDTSSVSELMRFRARLQKFPKFPKITTLNTSELGIVQNAVHIEVLIKLMSQAKWPMLTILNLQDIKLSAEAVTRLIKGKWHFLRTLNLSHCRLTKEACSALQHASWPELETLLLSGNDVSADYVLYLVQAPWPLLSHLDLCHNQIDDIGVHRLLGGGWPAVKRLVLGGNVLNMNASQYLSLGCWSGLEEPEVSCYEKGVYAVIGLTSLVHGKWPKLRVLNNMDNMDKIRGGILKALLISYKPLWKVLSAAASPGTGRVYNTANGVKLVQQSYTCP